MSKQTITEFLEARIAEDEAQAEASFDEPGIWGEDTGVWEAYGSQVEGKAFFSIGSSEETPIYFLTEGQAEHIARHDPARVLAECVAKRAIIEEHYWRSAEGARGCGLCNYSRDDGWEETGPCKTVRALAAVYADHPDYDPGWAQ